LIINNYNVENYRGQDKKQGSRILSKDRDFDLIIANTTLEDALTDPEAPDIVQ